MSEKFYSKVTKVGQAVMANALAFNKKIEFGDFVVGDGGGSSYEPDESQQSLKSEVWSGAVRSVTVGEKNPNEVIIDAYIPSSDGGFTIREFGIKDKSGNLLIVGKHPETYKPVAVDGTAKDLKIRVILNISNAENVIIQIDPSVALLTEKDLDRHNSDPKAHGGLLDFHIKDKDLHVTREKQDQWTEAARLTLDHVQNADIHVTLGDKEKWNDGLTKEDLARLDMVDGDLQAQLDKMRQLLLTDIRENEISITFENLEGIKLRTGNYNEARERVEV
ncbi:phage tail protein [uncultured Anaerococcus sp.]|uniref:phage tail protein n=1 Tax=uncultured Anaerococcus sp. TaxID=293428 RepID=UPI0028048F77|nr:phage tail protein [uncultured Anaerococcus sp.]